MIEQEVFDSIGPEWTDIVKQAIMALSRSTVLERQVKLELFRLADGDAAQSAEDLAKEILRVRADTRGLQLLHDYGLQLTQESEGLEA